MLWITLTIAGAWLALCALAYLFQDRLIFIPGRPPEATPRSAGLEFETVAFAAADGTRLQGWWIPAARATRTVVVCHGNAGSIENRIDLAQMFHGFGWSTLLFDYRGFGSSAGSPTVAGALLDADAAYDQAVARQPGVPVVVWGESLGGGIGAQLATRRRVDVLVLDSTFTGLADLGRTVYRFLPVRWLLKTDLDTRSALERTDAAVLVVHGRSDAAVPFPHAEANFAHAHGRKQLCEFQGGHNDRGWARDADMLERVRRFVEP